MRKLTVVESVSLDGVMQAPGGPDEDPRGGFRHGGWAVPYSDEVAAREMAKGMRSTELLFGRRTYEQFYSFWPHQPDNPYTEVLNNTLKYVAATTATEPLPWTNSALLAGDAGTTVAELKRQPGRDLTVIGSGVLVGTLIRHDLVDEYVLLIHPVLLGSGRRLFAEPGQLRELRLVDSVTTTTGVVIATYQPAEVAERGGDD